MTEKPRIIIPQKGEIFKFVQLEIQGKPYLRAGFIENPHHWILKDALDEFDIDFSFKEWKIIPRHEGLRCYGCCGRPFLTYESVGMGKMKRSHDELIFFDGSGDYLMSPNKEHLIKLLPYFPKDLTIKLEGRLI